MGEAVLCPLHELVERRPLSCPALLASALTNEFDIVFGSSPSSGHKVPVILSAQRHRQGVARQQGIRGGSVVGGACTGTSGIQIGDCGQIGPLWD